jgi:hypothetical protein
VTSVTFTTDDGATLTPNTGVLRGTTYSYGLVATDAANTLFLAKDRTVYRSANAGCRWTAVDVVPTVSDNFPLTLTAAPDGRAYAWADGRADLARVDGRRVVTLKSPVGEIVGMGTAADGTVRLGDGTGRLWESRDLGVSWTALGTTPVAPGTEIVYRAAFDPANLDHALVGTTRQGFFVTQDGGQTWTKATGLAADAVGPVNGFQAVVSPADPNTVYAMALDLNEADLGAPSGGRHIYASLDGGFSFAPVVDSSADVILPNGPVMAAHPADPDVVYFVYGTSVGDYGTDLYRYDGLTGQVTKTHNAYDRITAIAFNPADSAVMYLGLANESIF